MDDRSKDVERSEVIISALSSVRCTELRLLHAFGRLGCADTWSVAQLCRYDAAMKPSDLTA
jgi:hypothetical protein